MKRVFAHISNAHLIHDDLNVVTKTENDHVKAIEEVMKAISDSGLTLNPNKCSFGQKQIYGAGGMKSDPPKVEALDHISPPNNKEELISFLCKMESNSEFIENFAKKAAPLRDPTKGKTRFKWNYKHQQCFQMLVKEFKKDALLQYFDMTKPIYIVTDARISGIGAMLGQQGNTNDIKPIAFALRTAKAAESRYPQLDLEALAIDFGLRHFRNYLIGAPHKITVITDHKPLCSIFSGKRQGSIRTERIKLRHQDIQFEVVYQQGKHNQSDYLSKKAKNLTLLPRDQQDEADDINNLLCLIHTTTIIDHLGLAEIATETQKEGTLQKITELINN